MFSLVLIFKKFFEFLLARPNEARTTVGMTNIGRVNIPQLYGSFKLEEISSVVAQAGFGGFLAPAVTSFQGKCF
ncbi:hypothetical protein IQ276_014625 [Desmonostoc muscorum LEGE 12446]|uniref:Uncharacterized protein n=1 Tax=Desmonostoc muscorum LEGE 12446 TaxID=1828758 RepID=A0A8J7D1G7_DESMC|nr:hypothetical protein [Desmonostoc muscorum]MCF2147628.1 hypothetical protein [Desmonostoc muscorum LEGE 12446]